MPRSSSSSRAAATTSESSAGARWRLVLGSGLGDRCPDQARAPEPDQGALNMAVDQALFTSVRDGAAPVLRFYRWRPACLSLGRHQLAVGIYDPSLAMVRGIDVVRRPTGGLAVLHDAELTYSVITPVAPLGGPRAAYVRINQALVAGLRALGVPAALGEGPDTHSPSPDAVHPCFQRPAPGEVVAVGRKLVGSAQRVEQHCLLQHGSILLAGTQEHVVALQGVASVGGRGGEVTLGELLPELPPWADLLRSLREAFAATFGIRLAPAILSAGERVGVASELERFGSDAWTWRR